MTLRVCPRETCAELNEPDAIFCEACRYLLIPVRAITPADLQADRKRRAEATLARARERAAA